MKTAMLLENVSSEDLNDKFKYLQNRLDEISKNFEPKAPIEYLTREEVASLLKCDLSTLYHWTKKGKLKSYGIGNRVYYKRTEIELAIKPLNRLKND
ncbi:MAG TPA: helix-turn-helix domain-containing protein [Phnomibacter sp.]|nr:helix-turn-helix domain-containing protein [Phnomibacter sp.]